MTFCGGNYAPIAHPEEHLPFKQVVAGSSPAGRTKIERSTTMKVGICKLLCDSGACASLSQARRMVASGAVVVEGKKIERACEEVEVGFGAAIKVGKRETKIKGVESSDGSAR